MKYVDLINYQARTYPLGMKADHFVIAGADVPDALLDKLTIPYRVEPLLPCRAWCQDTLKIHAWKYEEYNRILMLDADCHFRRPFENTPKFGCLGGIQAPMNAARLIIQPNIDLYKKLVDTYPTVNYDFNCGNGFQGAIYHLFNEFSVRHEPLNDVQHTKEIPKKFYL